MGALVTKIYAANFNGLNANPKSQIAVETVASAVYFEDGTTVQDLADKYNKLAAEVENIKKLLTKKTKQNE